MFSACWGVVAVGGVVVSSWSVCAGGSAWLVVVGGGCPPRWCAFGSVSFRGMWVVLVVLILTLASPSRPAASSLPEAPPSDEEIARSSSSCLLFVVLRASRLPRLPLLLVVEDVVVLLACVPPPPGVLWCGCRRRGLRRRLALPHDSYCSYSCLCDRTSSPPPPCHHDGP